MSVGAAEGTINPVVATFMVVILNTGVAPLTLPFGFEHGGWLLALCLFPLCGVMSLLASTFVVETLSICNAIRQVVPKSSTKYRDLVQSDSRREPNDYFLKEPLEYSQLANMLLPPFWSLAVRIITCIYIGGACTIWVVAIGNTMGTFFKNAVGPSTETTAYYGALLVAMMLEVPLTMMGLSGTKKLQMMMVTVRISAIVVMDAVAIWRLYSTDVNSFADSDFTDVDIEGLKYLFGSAVFTLLWHYSIGSVVAPVRPQSSIFKVLIAGTGGMTVFFTLHCLLLVVVWAKPAGPGIEALINQNYLVYGKEWLILGLYPMLVSIAFPIIAGNLRNNLLTVVNIDLKSLPPDRQFRVKLIGTLVAVLSPFAIGMATHDVQIIIAVNAGFNGFMIQFIFPAIFLLQARKLQRIVLSPENSLSDPGEKKPLRSSMAPDFMIYLLALWGVLGIGAQAYISTL